MHELVMADFQETLRRIIIVGNRMKSRFVEQQTHRPISNGRVGISIVL